MPALHHLYPTTAMLSQAKQKTMCPGGGHCSDMSALLSILWFTSRSSVVCMCNGGKEKEVVGVCYIVVISGKGRGRTHTESLVRVQDKAKKKIELRILF